MQFANVQSDDSASAGLTATAESRAGSSVSGERAAGLEGDKLGNPRSRWRRALAPGSIVLLALAVIFLIKIVGAPPDWWPL
jgi:hypothetical protein